MQLTMSFEANSFPAPALLWAPAAPAAGVAAMLERGGRLIGLTAGQFSFLDLVAAIVAKTGPASLRLATWSLAARDVEELAKMRDAGALTSARLYVDAGLPRYKPAECAALRRTFGPDAISGAALHAKCAVIRSGEWAIAIRTSMNLNRNPRWESFDIDDDDRIARFIDDHFDSFDRHNLTPYDYDWTATHAAFSAMAQEDRPNAVQHREMLTAQGAQFGPTFSRWVDSRIAALRAQRKGPRTIAGLAKQISTNIGAVLAEMQAGGHGPLGLRIAASLV
jgi:hypothetical protein